MTKEKPVLSLNYSKKALEMIKKARSTMILPAKVNEKQKDAAKNPEKVKSNIKVKKKQEGGFFKKTINYLRSTYPKCFTNPISPLAIGIHKQLQEQMNIEGTPFTTKKSIHIFLHFYIDTLSYKSVCIEGAERRNLDGSVHSIITAKGIQNLEK
jgi:hypothetical protein